MKKVCLVIGAGAGIGGTVAKKFASDGYYAYLARRTDEEGLNKLIKEIQDSGGEASGSLPVSYTHLTLPTIALV